MCPVSPQEKKNVFMSHLKQNFPLSTTADKYDWKTWVLNTNDLEISSFMPLCPII